MLKPFKQFSYRYRNYVAAIALTQVNAIRQDMAQGRTQFMELLPSPKPLVEFCNMSGQDVLVSYVVKIDFWTLVWTKSFDLLKPAAKKLSKIVTSAPKMSAGVPIATDASANSRANKPEEGEFGRIKINVGHLICLGLIKVLAGFAIHTWGFVGDLENP